jgi:type I restriction enzyme, S subunit
MLFGVLWRRIILKSSWINNKQLENRGIRLGAGFHCSEGQLALRQIKNSSHKTQSLSDLCDELFIPSRFKRPYVRSSEFGLPYITGSTMLLASPRDDCSYLSKALTPKLNELLLRKGTLLTTCSGIIGRTVMVDDELAGCIGSPDLLRIVPNENKIKIGYLYTFLVSQIGVSLIQMQTYGSVIDHIEAHHVSELPVPRISIDVENEIDGLISRANNFRKRSNQLLKKANEQFLNLANLPPLAGQYCYADQGLKTFFISNKNLGLRLDASNHNLPGLTAESILKNHPETTRLGYVTKRIFHPFRMNMVLVEKEHGTPFLVGGDIVQSRYFNDKYMSALTENYSDYLLEYGWTLITRSGTIGRLAYVGNHIDGWAASEHIIRIVPNDDIVLPGYLYACLQSEYTRYQIENMIYGSVVDSLRESQLESLLLYIPPQNEQVDIHNTIESAFSYRHEADKLEAEALNLLYDNILHRKRTPF